MKKFVLGAVAMASLAGGSLAVAAVNPLGIAGAQDGTTGTTQPGPAPTLPPGSASAGTPPKGLPQGGPADRHGPRGGQALEDTLKELVANGTITQAQADAITSGVRSKIEAGGPGMGRGRPGMGFGKDMVEAAAAAIGIDAKTLLGELKDDKTLAAVATAHGVDPQKVIDALVAASVADIDKGVADGKIPADKADKIKAGIKDRITELVTNGRPGRGHGKFPGGPMGPGDRRPGGPTGPDAPDQGPPSADPSAPAPAPAAPPSTESPAPAPSTTTVAPSPSSTEAPPTAPPGTTAG